MNKHLNIFALILGGMLGFGQLFSQSVPVPGNAQVTPMLFRNTTIHTGNGKVLENADLLFSEGKILAIGKVSMRPAGTREIDLSGKHIWPGVIAMNTSLGLNEIEAVRATRDADESGEINPNARAIISYNTDSRVTPTVRSNGLLLAEIVPSGGLVSGSSAIVQLDAWNWEDAAVKMVSGVHLNWPNMNVSSAPKAPPVPEQQKNIEKQINRIYSFFDDALNYQAASMTPGQKNTDLKLEAMLPVLKKEVPLFVHAQSEKQIRSAVAFSKKFPVRIVIVGAEGCLPVADELKAANITVVLRKTHSLPIAEDEPLFAPFTLPADLKKAGVTFCISGEGFWDQRNLPFLAGTAAAWGLTKEDALTAITLTPATVLGIADQYGSLETGKSATFLVTSGDFLDMNQSVVLQAFINGREVDLASRQTDLWRKFKYKGQ